MTSQISFPGCSRNPRLVFVDDCSNVADGGGVPGEPDFGLLGMGGPGSRPAIVVPGARGFRVMG